MKLKVIHNLIDKQCGVVRYVGEVFEANEERAKELIKLKAVVTYQDDVKKRKISIVLLSKNL